MFRLSADLKVYLHREPIDFRAGINSLAVLVQEVMELDPARCRSITTFWNARSEFLPCRVHYTPLFKCL